jgi:hypothetical protein
VTIHGDSLNILLPFQKRNSLMVRSSHQNWLKVKGCIQVLGALAQLTADAAFKAAYANCRKPTCGRSRRIVQYTRQPSYSRTLLPSQSSTAVVYLLHTNCYQFTDPRGMDGLVDRVRSRARFEIEIRQTRGAVKHDGARTKPLGHADRLSIK